MNQFYTYLHCRPDGTPFYVGKGCAGRGHSRRSHDFKNDRNQHHRNIVSKYGANDILVYVFQCDSEQQAFDDEIQQIAQLRREKFNLCNQTDGGDGSSGHRHTRETLEKISAASKGNHHALGYKHSVEARAKISAAGVGRKVLVGKKQLPEHIAKRVAKMIGHATSEETRKKIGAAHKGMVMSEDARARMSAAKKGKPWSAARRESQNKNGGN